MARDSLGKIVDARTTTAAATVNGSYYDLKSGTPRRGIPLVWNTNLTAAANTATATLTIEATDNTATAGETIATFPNVLSTDGVQQYTRQVSTEKRYIRAVLVLAGGTTPNLVDRVDVTTANPT